LLDHLPVQLPAGSFCGLLRFCGLPLGVLLATLKGEVCRDATDTQDPNGNHNRD
jgi:hypothetical protein